MSTRKVKDAKDLSTNELIYFKSHAKATYMSDGTTVEDTVNIVKTNLSNLSDVATSGSYNDLTNKPTIPNAITESTVSGWGFTKNAGTITGITMNGVSKGTSGVINLGTVLTEHQSLGNYYTKSEIDQQLGDINSILESIIHG